VYKALQGEGGGTYYLFSFATQRITRAVAKKERRKQEKLLKD